MRSGPVGRSQPGCFIFLPLLRNTFVRVIPSEARNRSLLCGPRSAEGFLTEFIPVLSGTRNNNRLSFTGSIPHMPRTRKLFPVYGSALANNMLGALERARVVERFVSAYIEEYGRHGIEGGPARARELGETIGREVILTMILEVERLLPGFFGKKHQSKLTTEEKAAIQAFFQEWSAALARAWNWNREDRTAFRRDLALYSEFAARKTASSGKTNRAKIPAEDPPFVGRVALLLDPSMMEQARRASRKFHEETGGLAQKLLRQTLRAGAR